MLLGLVTPLVLAALVQTSHVVGAVKNTQTSSPGTWEPYFSSYEAETGTQQAFSFGPLTNLSALSSSEYTTLKHTAFPKYGVRVKKSQFCDGTVEYAAYHGRSPPCSPLTGPI